MNIPLSWEPPGLLERCLLLFALLTCRSNSQRNCPMPRPNALAFSCEFKISSKLLSLFCAADTTYDLSDDVYVFYITSWMRQDASQMQDQFSLVAALNSSSFSDQSNFYICSNQHRQFISPDLLYLHQFCITNHDCLPFAFWELKDAFVFDLEISHQTDFAKIRSSLASFNNTQKLVLTGNHEFFVSNDTFAEMKSVHFLNLSRNSISNLPAGVFQETSSLSNLDLSFNRLSFISQELFSHLSLLRYLNVSNNVIVELEARAFAGNPALFSINFSFNNLSTLPGDIFENLTEVMSLDVSGNALNVLPTSIFKSQVKLKRINLSNCALQYLNGSIFRNVTTIIRVDVSHNQMTVLSKVVFSSLSDLQYLDVSHNFIAWIDNDAFVGKENLKTLLLSNNMIKSFPTNSLASAKGLKILDLSENLIEMVDDKYIEHFVDLDVFNVSGNRLKSLMLGLYRKVRVRNLYFSDNYLTNSSMPWMDMVSLEKITFDRNELTELELPPCVLNMKQQITFSYKQNNISKITRNPSYTYGYDCLFNGIPKTLILLEGNPLNCDCNLYTFYEHLLGGVSAGPKMYSFPGNLTCGNPPALFHRPIATMQKDDLICRINASCPPSCYCYVTGYDQRIIVNCSSSELADIPSVAPNNSAVLYFKSNNLSHIGGSFPEAWNNLTKLFLDDNVLESIDVVFPESLTFLSLTGNSLKDLPESVKRFAETHPDFRMKIGGNKWYCDCRSTNLKSWLIQNRISVVDLDDVICTMKESNATRNLPLYKILDSFLCSPVSLNHTNIIVVLVVSSLVIMILLILSLAYYRNKETVLAFLFDTALFRQCFQNEDFEEDKDFDAFVAYSSLDRDVVMELVEGLEEYEPYFKICIHDRNWMPGMYVSENIVHSVQNSRRTIIVLSENFVSSMWFAIEIRAALFQTLEDRINRLLVVVVGDFPAEDSMDEDVRQILLRKTYLTWGERWFWEKLRYAMPHKSDKYRGISLVRRGRKYSDLIAMVDNDINVAITSAADEGS